MNIIQTLVFAGIVIGFIVYGIKLFLEKTNFSLEKAKALFYSHPVDKQNKKVSVRRRFKNV